MTVANWVLLADPDDCLGIRLYISNLEYVERKKPHPPVVQSLIERFTLLVHACVALKAPNQASCWI